MIELLDDEFARAGYEIEDVVIDERSRPPRITVIAAGDTALNWTPLPRCLVRPRTCWTTERDIGGTYVLEVSSPGVDRPLTSEKHFRRARGRKVDLTLTDGTQVSGRVGEIRDGTVDVVIRDGRNWEVRPIPLSDAAKAVVQVEFSQPPQRELELAGGSIGRSKARRRRARRMNIDMGALHTIVAERGISFDDLLEDVKAAVLSAYRHTEGHQPDAHIDIDRKSGGVRVLARELDADGNVLSEWEDTPEGFGRIAATTARQVMLQRLRDAENERTYGEFSTHEGEIVAGVIQRDSRANSRGLIVVRMGSETKGSEGVIPAAEQVPGESYEHGDRLRCYVVGVSRGAREPVITLSAHPPQSGPQTVLAGGPRDRRWLGGDRGGGPRSRSPLEDRGRVAGGRV